MPDRRFSLTDVENIAMYHDTERFSDLDFEQTVRQAAYLLWEQDGRPDGREKEYWFRALEQELAAREATSAPADQRLSH
jgi:hypothetical protein